MKGGGVCFTFQFIPWKKLYHQYLVKEDMALRRVEQVLQDPWMLQPVTLLAATDMLEKCIFCSME